MTLTQFLYPVLASVLQLIVFQKAGFRGAILIVCALPVVGAFVTHALIGAMMTGSFPMIGVTLVSAAFLLAPLLVLAFAAWPPVEPLAARATTEKNQ